MASVNFYLDKERNDKTLILITFTFNHERLRLSTGLHIPLIAWDKDDQIVKPLKKYAEENKKLRDIRSFLLDKYDELFPNGMSFTKEQIKEKATQIRDSYKIFTGKKKLEEEKKESLLSFVSTYQDRYKNKLTAAHLSHYNGTKKHLEEFQGKLNFKVDFNTIGKDFYIKFTDHLKEIGQKPNTIGSHIKRVKRLMNEANEDGLTKNQDHKKRDFKVITENVDTVYLTENEIKALYEMHIEIPAKRKIRDIFVLQCYTGLRHNDWSKVSIENIHDGKLYVSESSPKNSSGYK